MSFKAFLPAIVAAVTFALPADGEAKTYYRDRDHDGHYVKHHYDSHGHGRYYGRGYYGGYYGRPYYYGGYRPWGYGYGYPYYGYGFGPSINFSFYSRPSYATYSSRVYRGNVVNDSLAVDVQRALRSKGYYRGSIDGVIGDGSRAAISAYQRDRGLSVTSRIDRPLLRSLRID